MKDYFLSLPFIIQGLNYTIITSRKNRHKHILWKSHRISCQCSVRSWQYAAPGMVRIYWLLSMQNLDKQQHIILCKMIYSFLYHRSKITIGTAIFLSYFSLVMWSPIQRQMNRSNAANELPSVASHMSSPYNFIQLLPCFDRWLIAKHAIMYIIVYQITWIKI